MMSKSKSITQENQSKIDNTRDAKNAGNGFKNTMSSGTPGPGESYRMKK